MRAMAYCKKIKIADGGRLEAAGGTTSGKICESVVENVCTKFGNPRTSSTFLAKNIFFKMASAAERK